MPVGRVATTLSAAKPPSSRAFGIGHGHAKASDLDAEAAQFQLHLFERFVAFCSNDATGTRHEETKAVLQRVSPLGGGGGAAGATTPLP